MITDGSYFQSGALAIPLAKKKESLTGTIPDNADEITRAIDIYEPLLLRNALGVTNYNELKTQFQEDGSFKPDALDKWKDLVNGVDYEFEGDTYHWEGLRCKDSLVACFVFVKFFEDDTFEYNTTGLHLLKSKGSDSVNPNQKSTDIWARFLKKYQSNAVTMPSVITRANGYGIDWYNNQETNVSLYTYLFHNDIYGDYGFKLYSDIGNNVLGL